MQAGVTFLVIVKLGLKVLGSGIIEKCFFSPFSSKKPVLLRFQVFTTVSFLLITLSSVFPFLSLNKSLHNVVFLELWQLLIQPVPPNPPDCFVVLEQIALPCFPPHAYHKVS